MSGHLADGPPVGRKLTPEEMRVWLDRKPPPRELKVQYETTDDGVAAFVPAIGVAGMGPTPQVALQDARATARALYDEFRETPPEALHWSAERALRRLTPVFGEFEMREPAKKPRRRKTKAKR